MLIQTTPIALQLVDFDARLGEILESEPRLQAVFDQAANQEAGAGYDRILAHLRLKNLIRPMVGWYADKPELRNSGDYQLVIETILNLLPPDRIDRRYPPPPPYRR